MAMHWLALAILLVVQDSERQVAKIPPGTECRNMSFAPNGSRTAYSAVKEEKGFVVVDGVSGEGYKSINTVPVFTADGKHVAYCARAGDKYFVVVDDTKYGPYDDIVSPKVGATGSIAFVATVDKKKFAVLNGKKGEEFDQIYDADFFKDGDKFTYRASKGAVEFVMQDERKITPDYERIPSLACSPDGKTIAYTFVQNQKTVLMVGDRRLGEGYDSVNHPAFSEDGSKVAFIGHKNAKSFVVCGDTAVEFESQLVLALLLNRDGSRWACFHRNKNQQYLLLDGKLIPEVGATNQIFSPDGKSFAYLSIGKGGKSSAVVDDKKGETYKTIQQMQFSPDGKRLAFAGRTDTGKWVVVAGDKKSPEFDLVSNLTFSPDGKNLRFGAKLGDALWWKALPLEP